MNKYDPEMDSSECFMGMIRSVGGDYYEVEETNRYIAELEVESDALREAAEGAQKMWLKEAEENKKLKVDILYYRKLLGYTL